MLEIHGRQKKLQERSEGYDTRARASNVLANVREALIFEEAGLRNERDAVELEIKAIAAEQKCISFESYSVDAEIRARIKEIRHGVDIMLSET